MPFLTSFAGIRHTRLQHDLLGTHISQSIRLRRASSLLMFK